MTILAFPAVVPQACDFRLSSNTQVFTSPLNRATQTTELPGALWMANLTFTDLTRTQAALLEVFLVRLRGQAGRFYLHDHSHPDSFGVATGTPVVYGAGQTGASLITSGWTPSTAGILKARDYFQVGNKLRMLVEDATSDANGRTTLVFDRPLTAAPTNGGALTVVKPCAVMMLSGPDVGWSTKPPVQKSFSISCIEDVLA